MKRGASSIEVKKLNRNRVFRYLNSRGRVSMPDIAANLGMSGPTVLQIIKELKESQIVQEVGVFQSTGGRKAKAIASVQDVCYTVGLDITRNHVSLVLTNLSEKALKHERVREPFIYGDAYFRKLGDLLEEFLRKSETPREKIIGVGLSIPGILDKDNCIAYSHTLGLDHVAGEEFTKYIPYPCIIINDANAAAMAECSGTVLSQSVFYLLLSNSVGGAIVFCRDDPARDKWNVREGISRDIYMGGNQRAGEFGHMAIRPDGLPCYCGKKGCLDAYCSAARLADLTDGNLERFFQELEAGNVKWREIWEEYMDNLAIAVDNLRMCFDGDVVLGGYVGSYMGPHMEKFREKCAKRNIFGQSGDYVKACKYRIEASALGAAVCQIERYIDKV
ncbi:MAG: ROK family transcriptional regulator [Lachnospiraceae bacterium]|nr:ROK family transcriptional regulator [Lachnospiraceae bacterium]MCI9547325.1 ROK family transcriptional regulator [Lachnospiraceae bacterium]